VSSIKYIPAAHGIVQRTLRELGIAPNAAVTFERFPDLGKRVEELAWFITDRVKCQVPMMSEWSMLGIFIHEAFVWMNHAAVQEGATVREAKTAFMAGLLFHTPDLLSVDVTCKGVLWNPFQDGPLGEWLATHQGAEFTRCTTLRWDFSDRQIRLGLMRAMNPKGDVMQMDIDVGLVLAPPESMRPR